MPASAQEIPIASRAIATLSIPGSADFLAADGRAVWVTNEGRVEKLVHNKPGPVLSVPLTEPCGALIVAFRSLWVANCADSTIVRIDRSAGRILARIKTGLADPTGELSLAAGAGSIWVLSDRQGVLSRIDAKSNAVSSRITVAPASFAAVFEFGSVWITTTGSGNRTAPGSVQRIDPATNSVIATIPVGPVPRFLAAGEGGVWTLNQGDGTVSRIDPGTNRTAATIDVGMPGGGGDIATGRGKVWVRGKKALLATIDPTTDLVTTVFGPPAGSGAVRVAGDLVWVTAHDIRTVWVLRAR